MDTLTWTICDVNVMPSQQATLLCSMNVVISVTGSKYFCVRQPEVNTGNARMEKFYFCDMHDVMRQQWMCPHNWSHWMCPAQLLTVDVSSQLLTVYASSQPLTGDTYISTTIYRRHVLSTVYRR